MEIIKPGINIDFVGNRKWAFLLSGLLVVVTILSLVMHGGPNYGIDFAGGIEVRVRFNAPTDPGAVKQALKSLGMANSVVQEIGKASDNEFRIMNEREGLQLEGLPEKVTAALKKAYGDKFGEVRYVRTVGPKVGRDLREKALMAILFVILLIAVYISGRFEAKWFLAAVMAAILVGAVLLVQTILATGRGGATGTGMVYLIVTALVVTVGACWFFRLRYAMGAIVALLHDVVITVGVFSLLDKQFTLATVAALLTIIGYSLNDTIIVYDRIRENLKKGGRKEMGQVINEAVNQTLSRTILTSGTTLLVLVCLWLFGGGVIQDFALALLVGVVVGTYSSIFVASPVILSMPAGGGVMGWVSPSKAKPATKAAPAKAKTTAPPAKKKSPAAAAKQRPVKAAAASRAKKRTGKKKKKKGGKGKKRR